MATRSFLAALISSRPSALEGAPAAMNRMAANAAMIPARVTLAMFIALSLLGSWLVCPRRGARSTRGRPFHCRRRQGPDAARPPVRSAEVLSEPADLRLHGQHVLEQLAGIGQRRIEGASL